MIDRIFSRRLRWRTLAYSGMGLACIAFFLICASNYFLRCKYDRRLDRHPDGSLNSRCEILAPIELPFDAVDEEMVVEELILPRHPFFRAESRPEYDRLICELQFAEMKLVCSTRIPIFPSNDDLLASLDWRARLLGPSFTSELRKFRDELSVYDVLNALLEGGPPIDYGKCPVRNRVVQQAIRRAVLPAFEDSTVRRFGNASGIRGILVQSGLGLFAHFRSKGFQYVVYSQHLTQDELCHDILSHTHWNRTDGFSGIVVRPTNK